MRILLISKWIDGGVRGQFHHSGIWRDTFELACAFSDLGNQVAIVSPKPLPAHSKEFQKEFTGVLRRKTIKHFFSNSSVPVGKYEGSSMLRLDLATIFAYKKFRPDVIQFMQISNSLVSFFIKPKIISFYGVVLPEIYANQEKDVAERIKNWSPVKTSHLKFLENFLYRFLIKVLGLQNIYKHSQGLVILKHKKGYQKLKKDFMKNIFYIHKGVDFKKYSKVIRNKGQNIFYMGSLTYRKGIFDLIKAFKKISIRFPSAKLTIVGSGPSGIVNVLKNEVGDLDKSVNLVRPVSYQRKNNVFKKAGLFCLPSYADASPGVLLEAMACGLSIITTYETDPPMENGQNGILIHAGDIDSLYKSMEKLLLNPTLSEKLGASARKTAKLYSWENQAKKLLRVYQMQISR